MVENYSINLNPKQGRAFLSTKPETFFVGGLGCGKSYVLGVWTSARFRIVGSLGFIGAPTRDVLKRSTLRQVKTAWEAMGIFEGRDYVVGVLPPDDWGVEPLVSRSMGQNSIITFRWGSYIIVDGLDNFDKHRGVEFDYFAVDEFRDVKEEARDVLNGRLRGKAFMEIERAYNAAKQAAGTPDYQSTLDALGAKLGISISSHKEVSHLAGHKGIWVTTPPEDYYLLEKVRDEAEEEGGSIEYVHSSTYDNRHNLPDNYISNLLRKYDDITAQREIYGNLVAANKSPWLYKFVKKKHVVSWVDHVPQLPIYISFDFNLEPMTAGIYQFGYDWLSCLQIYEVDGGVHGIAEAIKDDWGGSRIFITGDREGHTRQKAVRDNSTMYDTICEILEIDKVEACLAPKANMGLKDSRTLCNSVVQHIDLQIDQNACAPLIKDLERARVDEIGELIKNRGNQARFLDHFDHFRYMVHLAFGDWFVR